MIPTKAYAVHNATGDPLRNNSVPVGPGATASRTARALQLSPNSLVKQYPELNVLINNAGIMKVDNVQNAVDDALASSIVTTNLLGPVRMTSALIEHLKQQPAAWVIHVTSGTAFVPLAVTAAYSATKAALDLVLAFATVPAQRHQRQGFGTSPAVCSNRTDGCGTGSRPARHAAARVHRRNAPGIGDRRAGGSDRASCLPP
jgi:NAD(P)-dependent dehydrogenase (short-subunit alcohol dehydrogenase family)